MAAVGAHHEPVHFQLAARADRDLGGRRHIAAETHLLRDAAELALGRLSLAPADLVGNRVQHRQMLGAVAHQAAAKFQRIDTGRLGDLVHEALDVDRILVVVDAAPEARAQVRVAHRVVDREIRNRIAEPALLSARPGGRPQSLESDEIDTILHRLRTHRGQDRLRGDTHREADQVALVVETGLQLAHRHRAEPALPHVLLAAPQQLDRHTWQLPRQLNRLGHVVLVAAPPEAAAEMHLVDHTLIGLQAGRLSGGGECRVAVLRRHPHFALLRRPPHRGVHRLHSDVVHVGCGIGGIDLFRGPRDRAGRVAGVVANRDVLCRRQATFDELGDRRTRYLAVRVVLVDDVDRRERAVGPPPGIGDHRDRARAHLQHMPHARHRLGLRRIEALDLAAVHRRVADRRVEQAGHLDVDAVDLPSGQLVDRVQPGDRFAGDAPVLGVLQRHRFQIGHRQFGRRRRDPAVGRLSLA